MTPALMINGHHVTEAYVSAKMAQYGLPPHMVSGMVLYLVHHISPGSFMVALLANDFLGAVARADDRNVEVLKEWAQFIYYELPSGSHGSPECVRAWLGQRPTIERQRCDTVS